MADIVLERDRLQAQDLPDCCMRCGAPATLHKERTFSWCPSWVSILILAGLLPYIIVSIVLTKRKRVAVPLCDQHENHWSWRLWVTWISFAIIGVLFIATMMWSSRVGDRQGVIRDIAGYACLGVVGLGIAWLIMAIVLQESAIKTTRIDDYEIALTHVAPAFAEALRDQRREHKHARGEKRDTPQLVETVATMPCPYCGEHIKTQARKCRFCKEDLVPETSE